MSDIENNKVRILFLYEPGVSLSKAKMYSDKAINELNTVSINSDLIIGRLSGIKLKFARAGVASDPCKGAACFFSSYDLSLQAHYDSIEEIQAVRKAHNADLVMVLKAGREQDGDFFVTGLSPQPSEVEFYTNSAFLGLAYYSSYYSIAHEVFHMLGAGHSQDNPDNGRERISNAYATLDREKYICHKKNFTIDPWISFMTYDSVCKQVWENYSPSSNYKGNTYYYHAGKACLRMKQLSRGGKRALFKPRVGTIAQDEQRDFGSSKTDNARAVEMMSQKVIQYKRIINASVDVSEASFSVGQGYLDNGQIVYQDGPIRVSWNASSPIGLYELEIVDASGNRQSIMVSDADSGRPLNSLINGSGAALSKRASLSGFKKGDKLSVLVKPCTDSSTCIATSQAITFVYDDTPCAQKPRGCEVVANGQGDNGSTFVPISFDGMTIIIPIQKTNYQDGQPANGDRDESIKLYHSWKINGAKEAGDKGQCYREGYRHGEDVAKDGEWTSMTFIDTDRRHGNCEQKFGIIDPDGQLSGFKLTLDYQPTHNSSDGRRQCPGHGTYVVPIARTKESLNPITFYVDADYHEGNCDLTFSISGRNDVELDVEFNEVDASKSECFGLGVNTVRVNQPHTITYATYKKQPGKCEQRFRIRKLK